MVSILIITYGRELELLETLQDINKYYGEEIELLILDNNQTRQLEGKIKSIFNENKSISLSYFNEGINYGVALGRNYLIKRAKGNILITLDDDIEIKNINELIDKVQKYFEKNLDMGCLAFNIKNFYTKKQLRHEIPHGNKKLNFEENQETYYFIGAGHAIKKEVYDKCGLYPDDLGKYGGEERDLSFRILEKDYRILYVADIVIYHKISPNGRMKKEEENYYRYRNQLLVLNRYMPLFYRMTSNIIWSFYYFLIKKGKLTQIYNVLKECKTIKKNEVRSQKILDKIKKVKGRLLY